LLTSSSPFAALVLVKAGSQQRGRGNQVNPLIHGFQVSVEGFERLFLLSFL
jgi:hypothetical protein